MINYAHRGASEVAPENTMSAFCIGLAMGANGIETDVRHTRDGKLVLFHDSTMQRTVGVDKRVEDLTYQELLEYECGSYRAPVYAGERIVLLEEFLHFFARKDITFAIELKGDEVEQGVLDCIERFGIRDRTVVTSFHLNHLETVRSLDADLSLGLLTDRIEDELMQTLQGLGIRQYCPKAEYLTPEAVQKAKDRGFDVRAWGVGTRELMAHAVACKVDGMTVNFPDALKAYLEK